MKKVKEPVSRYVGILELIPESDDALVDTQAMTVLMYKMLVLVI